MVNNSESRESNKIFGSLIPIIYKSNLLATETEPKSLPMLDKINLDLTADKIFSWLKIKP
ncbi:hypothetical protein [Aphanothece sacrum]|uniref:Uncharacterized protein n=1 Tax=Aphanothece sacrum FPU1 TaxID=1920663 RepID=A0A401IMD3_APHSA|nr:hypothetical protein [Aphanothece sacrum]GBF82406.1 hypothetical protein AsFPU1_3835 [Aphanothece sacrum FPU1]GBF84439.1 hypothetical protein AsFPU3_1488 [Aphanothece sacrum FPU3]